MDGVTVYRVILTATARRELYEDAFWWAEHRDSAQAMRWMEGIELAIQSLAIDPHQQPLAPESDQFPFEMRQLLYGLGKRATHRVAFEIRGEEVFIHGVRHLARDDLTIDDLER
jgi:hypothetical protein